MRWGESLPACPRIQVPVCFNNGVKFHAARWDLFFFHSFLYLASVQKYFNIIVCHATACPPFIFF